MCVFGLTFFFFFPNSFLFLRVLLLARASIRRRQSRIWSMAHDPRRWIGERVGLNNQLVKVCVNLLKEGPVVQRRCD